MLAFSCIQIDSSLREFVNAKMNVLVRLIYLINHLKTINLHLYLLIFFSFLAVASSVWVMHFSGRLNDISVRTVNGIARGINAISVDLYRIGTANEGNPGRGLIELSSIFHSRTEDLRNIIDVTPELRIVFEHALCALDDANGSMRVLPDYVDGHGSADFLFFFARFMESHDNVVVFGGLHYVTILKSGGNYLLIDGLGKFRIHVYSRLSALIGDVTNFVGNGVQPSFS